MTVERRLWFGLSALLVALLVAFVGGWAVLGFLEAKRCADQSAQDALMTEAARLLDVYHREHGDYPKSLDSFAFTYPDGGDESILATLHYKSNGQSYSLTAKCIWSEGDELVVGSDSGGRVVRRKRER